MKNGLIIIGSLMLSSVGLSQSPKIKKFEYGGSGCPRGSAKTIVVSNLESSVGYFQVVFNKYLAERGPGKSAGDSSKSCSLSLSVNHTPGYRFTMKSVEFDGFGDIASGAEGNFTVGFKIPVVSPEMLKKSVGFPGPWSGDWSDGSSEMVFDHIYSDCSGDTLFVVDTFIRLRGSRDKISEMGVDVSSGKLKQNIYLDWKKCN